MRAAFLTGHGGNEVVSFGERPTPHRTPGDVRVAMKAGTLNRVDLYMRDSGAGITHSLPQIMGVDGAGVIEEVGGSEGLLRKGQRVLLYPAIGCGRCEYCQRGETMFCLTVRYLGEHRDGTFCDYVSVPAANVLPLPDGLDFAQGAALGVTYLTAWRMLFTRARLMPWETVLIFGIGGGVSLAALQLAKMTGATALVTSRSDVKLAQAAAVGADIGINGATQEIVAQVMEVTGGRGVDVVIENVGEAVWPAALRSLARGGRIVTCGATSGDSPSAELRRLFIRQISVLGSTLGTIGEFRDLLGVCASGKLSPIIDSRRPIEAIHDALASLEAGGQFGKIAIEIEPGVPAEGLDAHFAERSKP